MMDPRQSFKIYPRIDLDYQKKQSLNFDMMSSEVFLNRPGDKGQEGWKWFALLLIGFSMGMIAFGMSSLEEFLIDKREYLSQKALKGANDSQFVGWIVIASYCLISSCFAATLTTKFGPGANGSGIAELMAYLNGVNYPKLMEINSLITKIFGAIFGINGGLCIGKEGPLAHIGAVTALSVIYYVPIPAFDFFKNDVHKREFVCAGISAGVSAAFGAPIGGTLFSYELSKPTTFWTFSMLWRIFFCCCCSTFTLSFFTQLKHSHGSFGNLEINSAGTLKFGQLQDISVPLQHVGGAFVLGVMGGTFGSLFISASTYLSFFRKKYITNDRRRIFETTFFGVITITAMTVCVMIAGQCKPIPEV